MVYVPGSTGGTSQWRKPSECVWIAPSHLSHVIPLQPHYGQHQGATHFFQHELKVPDAGIRHYVEELRRLSSDQSAPVDEGRVQGLYQDIQRFAPNDTTHVRYVVLRVGSIMPNGAHSLGRCFGVIL